MIVISTILLIIAVAPFAIQEARAYENSKYGFSINAPSGWQTLEGDEKPSKGIGTAIDYDISVNFMSPDNSSFLLIVAGKRNYEGVSHDSGWNYLKEVDYNITQAVNYQKENSNTDSFSLLSEGSKIIGGMKGYELVYSCYNYYYGKGEERINYLFFEQNGKGYEITTIQPENSLSWSADIENSLMSFRVGGAFDGMTVVVVVILVVFLALVAVAVLKRRRTKTSAM